MDLFKIDVSKIEAEKELRRTKRKQSSLSKKGDSPEAPSPLQLSKDVTIISGDQDEDITIEEDKVEEKASAAPVSP